MPHAKAKDTSDVRIVATNRKARHLYHIGETWEAGIALRGAEVKSLRSGAASLADSYAEPVQGEVWLMNCHIPPYEQANRFNSDSKRRRRLLLHRKEIRKITGAVSQKGYTLVPLRLYFQGQHVKVEIALSRGKKEYDKREDIKDRETRRELDRYVKMRR